MVEFIILSFIPLAGTALGAFLGIFNNFNNKFEKQEEILVAVATGILEAICFSLFVESFENIRNKNLFIGILIGFLFILLMNLFTKKSKSNNIKLKLFWAMLIHNIPEGIIIGIALSSQASLQALSLVFSISLQNIPDGIVVSMPAVSTLGKKRALLLGIFSGVVEPIAALLIGTLAANSTHISTLEPILTGFSLSAIIMITFELIRECQKRYTMAFTAMITIIFNSILS